MPRLQIILPSVDLEFDKKQLRQVLRAAGKEVADVARRMIRDSVGSGNKRSGEKQASAPGQAPVNQSGKLADSISIKPSKNGESVTIKDSEFYALMLEAGAIGGGGRKGSRNKRGKPQTVRVLEPRPFLSIALEERSDSITERVKKAMESGLKFEKKK